MGECSIGDSARKAQIDQLIRIQFEMLQRYESVDGGWGYYDFRLGSKQPASSSISFVNGTVLLALHEAEKYGIEPPEGIVKELTQQRSAGNVFPTTVIFMVNI